MKQNELKEYIKIVYEMEVSLFQQKNLINNLETKIASLAINQSLCRPTEPDTDGYALFQVISCVLVGVIGVFMFMSGGVLLKIIGGFLAVGGILGAFDYLPRLIANGHEKAQYKTSLKQYNDTVIADASRVEREKAQKLALLKQLSLLKRKYNESSKLLDDIYSVDVIYHKYRGLIPISSIYDYLMSGVCSQLGGHEGAYNKYDVESRLDKIITKLDVIIMNLDQIAQSQYMLYRGITKANRINSQLIGNLERMQDNLTSIKNNSAIKAHETKLVRKELEYRNYMDRKFGRWD